jgi:hypothetical protein
LCVMVGSMTDALERNKRTVTAFYDRMFNQCRPREAIAQYVGAHYIQLNPGVGPRLPRQARRVQACDRPPLMMKTATNPGGLKSRCGTDRAN